MKYLILLILTIGKLIQANEPVTSYDIVDNTPALLFAVRSSQFYIIPTKNYSQDLLAERKEKIAFTCPASQDEIKSLKNAKILKNREKLQAEAASINQKNSQTSTIKSEPKLQNSSSVKESQLQTSSSEKEPELRPSPSTKSEPSEDISESSAEEEFKIPPVTSPSNHDTETDDDDYDDDYFTDMSEILEKLASPAKLTDYHYRPTINYCEKDFRPQRSKKGDCGRIIDKMDHPGRLYSISYKIFAEKRETKRVIVDLHVYAKCFNFGLQETLYVMYKIIPTPLEKEPQPIDYKKFDPTQIYHKDVYSSYFMNQQRTLLKKQDDKIKDDVIPQRLIPVYSIAEDYSKGTVANDRDIFRPQWRSKAKIWDDVARMIFNHGKKLQWLIYTGTVETIPTLKKEPLVIRSPSGAELSIPLYWWTFIMKTNSLTGEGIIIGMLNEPNTTVKRVKNYKDLCSTRIKKTCAELGWGEIITAENSDYILCCEVNGDTTESLIGYRLKLNVLSLENEKQNETEQHRVKVNTLLKEYSIIGRRYVNWIAEEEEKQKNAAVSPEPPKIEDQVEASSPKSTPSEPESPNPSNPNPDNKVQPETESPYMSPLSSPDRKVEPSSPRSVLMIPESDDELDEATVPETKSNKKKYFSFTYLPNIKSVFSRGRSPTPT